MAPRDNDNLNAAQNGTTSGGQANYGSTLKSWWQRQSSSTESSNYGSYQSIPTTCKDLELQEEAPKEEGHRRRRQVVKLLQLLAMAAFAWVAFDYFLRGHGGRAEDRHNDHDGFSYRYTDMNDTKVLPPAPVHHARGTKNKRQPLSTVHPVELGVPQFSRPKSTRPSEVLTHNKKTNKTKNDGHRGLGPTHFPTNAWYQNMLLIADGGTGAAEPTDVNRAYSTPFLVDAVGPIPGLRLLPNQVSASTSVIQINDLVEYGLTVGAAPDATTTLMYEHGHHHVDKNGGSGRGSHQRKLKKHQEHTTTTTTTHKDKNSSKSSNSNSSSSNGSTTTTSNETSSTGNDSKDSSGKNSSTARTYSNEYSVDRMTPLGLTLRWDKSYPMSSSIVKGMPYGTMVYETTTYKSSTHKKHGSSSKEDGGEKWYPTVASQIPLAQAPIVDGKIKLACLGQTFSSSSSNSTSQTNSTTTRSNSTNSSSSSSSAAMDDDDDDEEPQVYQVKVEKEVELFFADSDFTWLVFVSKPVTMQCVVDKDTHAVQLQVVDDTHTDDDNDAKEDGATADGKEEPPFVIRIALAKFCTSNKNPIYCHHEQMLPYSLAVGQGRYEDLLRNHSRLVPGPNTDFDYNVDQTKQQIDIVFDWDARDMRDFYAPPAKNTSAIKSIDHDLIGFALPHHLDLMGTRYAPGYLKYCANTLIGPACMLAGSQWTMVEHVPDIDFRAPRPPAPWAIKSLAKSAKTDINYKLPRFYKKGAGDTYFSGKMLAKLGRVLVVVEELQEICGQSNGGSVADGYKEVCRGAKIPTEKEVDSAVAMLRSSVEVWLSGKAVTPFVFDDAWGGVVSCGCNNPDGGECRNKFPECPAFTDPGLNFGNAFYNDLHFHYGYHIYAAAVVSHFDPAWGKKYFERVLLLVRNIANPADSGDYFPAFRHKDWYQGHSWASGVVPPYLNGRNQESSSESIAAYEAVALYGRVMARVFDDSDGQNQQVANEVEKAGQVLTATELRSTRRYYHVRAETNANEALKIYPSEYNNHAIGMMWNTMAQYQTWFGGKPYLAVGIQLLPITPIAEQRDGVVWLAEMYPSFAKTCSANTDCEEQGWSVLQLASLATIGYREQAAKEAEALNSTVFDSAGGNGHSLTNTLWYIATRAVVDEPINIGNATSNATTDDDDGVPSSGGNSTENGGAHTDNLHVLTHCYQPQVCTDYVLDTIADEYTCRQRIISLMDTGGQTQEDACFKVAKIQFPQQCGACVPNATNSKAYRPQCPPCTVDQCESGFNVCPQFSQTFVCTHGPNKGGCSRFPWDVRSAQCTSCCELTECLKSPAN